MLLNISQSSDFKILSKEISFTPKEQSFEKHNIVKKLDIDGNEEENSCVKMHKIGFFEMLKPYKLELLGCLICYLALLGYSLVKGGKGFKRYLILFMCMLVKRLFFI